MESVRTVIRNLCRSLSAGASYRSVLTSTLCWQVFFPRAPLHRSSMPKPYIRCASAFLACPYRRQNCPLSPVLSVKATKCMSIAKPAECWSSSDCLFCHSFCHSLSRSRGCDRRSHLPDGSVYPGRFAIRVGHPGRLCDRLASHHIGQAVCIHVLLLEGYTHPLRYAVLRILLSAVFGYLCALPLPPSPGLNRVGEW